MLEIVVGFTLLESWWQNQDLGIKKCHPVLKSLMMQSVVHSELKL